MNGWLYNIICKVFFAMVESCHMKVKGTDTPVGREFESAPPLKTKKEYLSKDFGWIMTIKGLIWPLATRLSHHEKFWLHVWLIILLQIQTILNVQDELSLKIQVYMYQQTKYFLHDNKVHLYIQIKIYFINLSV